MSGWVLPPCSGVEFQARFGLRATFLPGLKNLSQPPIFAMPASTIFAMSVPWTTTTVATGSAAQTACGRAAAPATAAAPALMNVRRFMLRTRGSAPLPLWAGTPPRAVSRFMEFSLSVG